MTHALAAAQSIELARWVESCGWRPTPLHVVGPDRKTCSCPKGGNCGKSAGKHNIAKGWEADLRGVEIFAEMAEGRCPRFKDGVQVGFFPPRPRMNVGILTGAPSGIVVLDIDVNGGGFESMGQLVAQHGALPDTFIVKTGTGGYHYYFRLPAGLDVRNSASKIADGVDIRGNGGMVVAPGSISWAGAYEVVMNCAPAPMPEWLVEAVRPKGPAANAAGAANPDTYDPFQTSTAAAPATTATATTSSTPNQRRYAESIVRGELQRVATLAQAGWNRPWDVETFQAACQLIELANAPWSGVDLEEVHQQFLEHCPPAEPSYSPEAKWASALNRIGDKARPAPEAREDMSAYDVVARPPADPTQGGEAHREGASTADGPFELTDVGNANRIIRWHGDALRYITDQQAWMSYAAGRWSTATAEVDVEAYAKSALQHAAGAEYTLHSDIPTDFFANGNPKPTDRDRFVEWIRDRSMMYPAITRAIGAMRSDARMRVKAGEFDADPMIFNALNCAIDLRTGAPIEHDPSLMLSEQAEVIYDPSAKSPLWDAFLLRVQPEAAMREWLQMVFGYTITGRMDEQEFYVHNGPGATGKSTALEVVAAVMGSYSQKLDRETLMSKRGKAGAIPVDVARMAGKRFLAASESKAGDKFDDERIKELVGGDTVTARFMRENFFEYQPTGKIHIATNHLPEFESGGDGMGRRTNIIPWEQQIPKAERDKSLKARIVTQEASGVLNWLVRGAVAWHNAGGLVTPQLVVERTEAHVVEADPIWPFVHDRLVVDADAETEWSDIWASYQGWCHLNGHKEMSGKALVMGLIERLGHEARYKHPVSRRSVWRVRVQLVNINASLQRENFLVGGWK